MSELDRQLRVYASWLASTSDERAAGGSPPGIAPPGRGRGGWPVGVAAVLVGAVLMSAVVAVVIGVQAGDSDSALPPDTLPVPDAPTRSVRLNDALVVPVLGEPAITHGITVYEGALGAAPPKSLLARFGDAEEVPLEPIHAVDLALPDDFVDRLDVDVVVTLGRRDGVNLVLYDLVDGAPHESYCVAQIAADPSGPWTSTCTVVGGPMGSSGVSTGSWALWAGLPEGTGVVALVDDDGVAEQYQRPVAGTVAFQTLYSGRELVAYDEDGTVLEPILVGLDEAAVSAPDEGSTSTTEPDIETLISTPIDQFPAEMYSVSDCAPVLTSGPSVGMSGELDLIEPGIDELAEMSVIGRFRVLAVDTALSFVPDGLPDEVLAAAGASDANAFRLAYTPITVQALEVVRGEVGERSQTVVPGCWGAGATDIVRPGSEVVILGQVPDPPVGIMSITWRRPPHLHVARHRRRRSAHRSGPLRTHRSRRPHR